MDVVRDDVLEKPLVVGDDDDGAVRAPKRVDAVRHDAKGIDVEARVGLVEDCQARFEEHHLEDLVPLLLAAGKALVERPSQQPLVHFDELHLLAHELHEVDRVELLVAARPPYRIDRRLEEVRVVDAGDLHRVLEREEDSPLGALVGLEGEKVLAPVGHSSASDVVALPTGEDVAQAALSGPVRTHHGVHLARLHREVHPPEDGAAVHGDVKIGNFKDG